MDDEAILRIIMQGSTPGTASPPPAPTAPAPSVPTRPQSYHHTAPATPSAPAVPTSPYTSTTDFDPVKVAERRIEREDQRAQVDVEYAKLKPVPLPDLDIPFDPVAVAMKRVEREDQMAAVDAEYAKLRPATTPPFDPVEEAKKRLERDKKRWAVDEEYEKLRPPDAIKIEPAFDPQAEAKKRRDKEKQKGQVDQAYKEQYGGGDTGFDKVLKVVDSFRGTLGGVFGRGVGVLLDLAVGLRKAQVETPKPPIRTVPTFSRAAGPTAIPSEAGPEAKHLPAATVVPSPPSVVPATGGGAAGAAAAAVPIGLIVAAALEARQAIIDGIKGAVSGAGNVVSGIASANADPAVPIAKFGDTVSKVGEKIPILGTAAVVAGESLKALAGVMQELNKTADRYGEYSPAIAQAQAIAEVRQVMGDFRRSQQIGPEMAKFIMAQSDMQQRFEDIKIRLLTKIVPIIVRLLEVVEAAVAAGEVMITPLVAPLAVIAEVMSQLLNLQRDAQRQEVVDPTNQLFDPKFMEAGLGHDWDPGWVPRR